MAKALICDRCGCPNTRGDGMHHMEITPYCSLRALNETVTISIDLCDNCVEAVMKYVKKEAELLFIRPEVQAGP